MDAPVKIWNVLRRPIVSDAAAQPILPPRFAAERSSRYEDAKLAVTIVGRVEENTSDIIGFAWIVSKCTEATPVTFVTIHHPAGCVKFMAATP